MKVRVRVKFKVRFSFRVEFRVFKPKFISEADHSFKGWSQVVQGTYGASWGACPRVRVG